MAGAGLRGGRAGRRRRGVFFPLCWNERLNWGQAASVGGGGFLEQPRQVQRRSLCLLFHEELCKNVFVVPPSEGTFSLFTFPLLPAIPPLLCFAEGQINNLNNGIKIVTCVFEQGFFLEPRFIVIFKNILITPIQIYSDIFISSKSVMHI